LAARWSARKMPGHLVIGVGDDAPDLGDGGVMTK
jgi:hypothetical protein